MTNTNWLAAIKKTASERPARGDNSRRPRGNITATVREIDTDHDQHGWLMKVEVTGGTNGVGETIDIAPTRQAVEWAEKGKLDQKISVGSEIVLQRLSFPKDNDTVYHAARVTGFVLDHDKDKEKHRHVLRRVPYKMNMFKNGYALVVALPETKAELGDPSELVARIKADQEANNQTLVIGRVNDTPFYSEAITGRYDREKGEYIPFAPESVAEDIMGRIADVTRATIEKAEADGQPVTIEMNAYGLKSYPVGSSTRDMLNEQMAEKGRFSQLPLEAMFVRRLPTHIRTALASLGDDAKRINSELKSWVETKLGAEERKAYAQSGLDGLDEATLGKFLTSLGIELPRVPSSQAVDWADARAQLDSDKRKRVSTGWLVGDVVIQGQWNKKTKKVVMEYPVRTMYYTASGTSASPFFPDEKFLKERNDTFFTTVREGFKAYLAGGVQATKSNAPEVAETSTAPSDSDLSDALSDLLNDDTLDTNAFPEGEDVGQLNEDEEGADA